MLETKKEGCTVEEWNRQCLEVNIYNRMQQLYSRYRSTHPREAGAELADQYAALLTTLPEEQAAVIRAYEIHLLDLANEDQTLFYRFGLLDGMAIAATVQDVREQWGGALWDELS